MKILAVDDEELIIRLLGGTLESIGYKDVDFAQSAAEALEMIAAARVPYDCFLLDIKMPAMDGIELCREIRRLPAYGAVPVLMLTAMKDKHYIDDSFAAGATDYINKPIDAIEIAARLRVAQILLHEQVRSAQNAMAGQKLRAQYENAHDFDLSEAVVLEGIPRVVSSLALENYMLQLSRVELFKNGAIGIQIRDVGGHFRNHSATDFYYLLADVADTIFECLRGTETMISYFGSGGFVAVVPRVNALERESLEHRINADLAGLELIDSQGQPFELQVSVGPQINSSLFGHDAKEMILRALAQADPTPRHMRPPRQRRVKAG